ncbi:hypothetical protein RJ639_014696 [Escallonia herrerae]|uniref:BHLH domain-containing protein n=1 Tax=Escallonia herrerae TaxID=1293975 RepID=A0AA88VEX4_9ASTE|nr:hypothetical protein RJ639_014696 [Escallonia herrerae]
MADFSSNLQSLKPSFSFLNFDPNMELMSQFAGLNSSIVENSTLNFQSFFGFSNDTLCTQQVPDFPGYLAENFPSIFHPDEKNVLPVSGPVGDDVRQSKKRKATQYSETSSGISSPLVSENEIERNNGSSKGKKMKRNEKEEKKPKEVVHVRARRGQATDSHSLAERVRRGKINERLRCLQDIVPGCSKTMGMAVMLDEIINYVQSLQNQVEFLSMKLTAASSFYDFNSETDAVETIQRAMAHEAKKMQRVVRGGYEGLATPPLGPLDLTFGSYPQLPSNT